MRPLLESGKHTAASRSEAETSAYWETDPKGGEAAFVERWSFSVDRSLPPPIRVLPTGLVSVLFSRPIDGDRWSAIVLGPATRAVIVSQSDLREQLHAWLQPGVARSLFHCSPDDLGAEGVPLADVRGAETGALLDALCAARDWAERRATALSGFVRLAGSEEPAAALVRCAVRRIRRDRGQRTVRSLCSALGVDRRRLERAFKLHLGVSPKLLARIVRFRCAREALRNGTSAAEVALSAGYSDQAHMTREFHEFAGIPPSRLARPA